MQAMNTNPSIKHITNDSHINRNMHKLKCNSPKSTASKIDVGSNPSITYWNQPHNFKTHLLRKSLHTLVRIASFPSYNNPPPWGPTSSLAHRLVSSSNTQRPKHTDNKYCPFWPAKYRHQPCGFKTHLQISTPL